MESKSSIPEDLESSEYTRGAWRLGTYPNPLEAAGKHDICVDLPDEGLFILASCNQNFMPLARANAQRIVDCVNACSGVSREDLLPGRVRKLLDAQATIEKEGEAGTEAGPLDAYIAAWELPDSSRIEKVSRRDDIPRWALRRGGLCLSQDLEWEYEPMPSNRDEDFLKKCRWDSPELAYAAWLKLEK